MSSDSPLIIGPQDLPETLPVFPLPGTLLLPRCHLPLNIFEPRYVHMLLDAMGHQRMIGIIQPSAEAAPDEEPPLYATGCAGRVVFYEETQDHRLVITLRGLCRFHVKEELPSRKGYRIVVPDWQPYVQDFATVANQAFPRDMLIDTLASYLQHSQIDIDLSELKQVPDNMLVNILSMALPFADNEKQALLECVDDISRAGTLIGLLQMENVIYRKAAGGKQ